MTEKGMGSFTSKHTFLYKQNLSSPINHERDGLIDFKHWIIMSNLSFY